MCTEGELGGEMVTLGQLRVTFRFNCGLVTGFEDNYLCRVPGMGAVWNHLTLFM